MANPSILVIEDEKPIRDMLVFGLRRGGFQVAQAADSGEAYERLEECVPDLMLVDWMLPDMSGLDLTRSLKRSAEYRDVPVIMLTARATENDKVAGLQSGADDYITKPFSQRELQARISAVLRRTATNTDPEVLETGGLRLNVVSHRVSAGDIPVVLGPTEFRLLRFFMNSPERVFSRGQLIDQVWDHNTDIEERTVDVHVRRLRKALAIVGLDRLVQTVRGTGYRFSAQPPAV